MLAHERQAELEQLLKQQGTVLVSAVAKEWGVSEMTIRRDLKSLEERGMVNRIHGGAVAGGTLRFQNRMDKNRAAKTTAITKLANTIPDTGCIYLDGSTTVYHFIDFLDRHPGLTVATNNIDTFHRLGQCTGIEAVLIGGRLNTATDNMVGPLARRCLDGLAFTAAYTSAYAMDAELGPSEPHLEDAEVKELVCQRSHTVFIAVNHHKLGQRSAGSWAPRASSTILATDYEPGDERLAAFRPRFSAIR